MILSAGWKTRTFESPSIKKLKEPKPEPSFVFIKPFTNKLDKCRSLRKKSPTPWNLSRKPRTLSSPLKNVSGSSAIISNTMRRRVTTRSSIFSQVSHIAPSMITPPSSFEPSSALPRPHQTPLLPSKSLSGSPKSRRCNDASPYSHSIESSRAPSMLRRSASTPSLTRAPNTATICATHAFCLGMFRDRKSVV